MAKADDVSRITTPLSSRLKTSLITQSSNNLTLIAVINKNNKVDNNDGSRIIRNLAKFKSLKNSVKYEKLIRNLVKFKIFKGFSFLSSAIKIAYIQLRQTF